MKTIVALSIMLLFSACTKKTGDDQNAQLSDQFVKGELAEVAKERGLKPEDLISAVKTFNPSGALDEYLAFFGTGVSGRLAVVGMPSMRVLKYVAVFSAEPWQGFAFDDESKAVIKGSAREEIEYSFGDMGTPALSLTKGAHDGRALFLADGANGRIGIVDLSEYETKQIVTHPYLRNSNADVAVSANTDYVAQTTSLPESFVGARPVSAATFWRFIEKESEGHKHFFIDPSTSFTVLLPEGKQSSPAMGKGESDGLMISVSEGKKPYLNVVNWKKAEGLIATKSFKVSDHFTMDENVAMSSGVLVRHELPAGSYKVTISGNGNYAVIANKSNSSLHLVDMKPLMTGTVALSNINIGGTPVDTAFTDKNLYVTVHNPNKVVRISLADKAIKSSYDLGFPGGNIIIPEADTHSTKERYAMVVNHMPYGRFTRVGPQTGLSAHLIDLREDKITGIYDASIPQSTRLGAVVMSTSINKPIFRYRIGTDPRSGQISYYRTPSGQEKVVRDGKRVHVYATVIRSHITPDFIEVEQGDTVSIHITSTEQARDQTHGFTIDTYNVHGSWEPGKTATLTFVADRAGVFPFYCTEFCSALHLEMQGYLLVKPKSEASLTETDELKKMRNNPKMKSFFNYIKGE